MDRIKKPKAFNFTKAQLKVFPLFDRASVGIWVLADATDEEYMKLFRPGNWKEFLKPRHIKVIKKHYEWFEA